MKKTLSVILLVAFIGCQKEEAKLNIDGDVYTREQIKRGLSRDYPRFANLFLRDDFYLLPDHDSLMKALRHVAHREQYAYHYRPQTNDCEDIAGSAKYEVQKYVSKEAALLWSPVDFRRSDNVVHQVIAVRTDRGLFKWDPQIIPTTLEPLDPNTVIRAYSL